ncbi:MAG: hypothetical protein GXO22_01455 [Aquificae bacterium]|nr:hypothetical protein [Aquificota bacterium]
MLFSTVIRAFIPMVITVLLTSCGDYFEDEDDEYENITKQGWHMQGRDCLACHNIDLGTEKHLTIGGTVFKSPNITDPDDLDNVCGGNIYVRFVEPFTGETISSKDYIDPDSKGYLGKGNIFILSRLLSSLQGEFIVQIIDDKNNVLATSGIHSFSNQYIIENPTDPDNRYSCNACHSIEPKGGASGVIYVDTGAVNLCE